VRVGKIRLTEIPAAYRDVVVSPSSFPLWTGHLLSSFGETPLTIAPFALALQLTGRGVAAEIVPSSF